MKAFVSKGGSVAASLPVRLLNSCMVGRLGEHVEVSSRVGATCRRSMKCEDVGAIFIYFLLSSSLPIPCAFAMNRKACGPCVQKKTALHLPSRRRRKACPPWVLTKPRLSYLGL